MAALFSATLAYSLVEPHRVVARRVEVALPGLPDECEGLRIAQLSDLHCSAITSREIIRRAVEVCNAEKPDVVALTGDYITRPDSYLQLLFTQKWALTPAEYAPQVAEEVGRLQAPEGVFAVHGNHDFAAGGFEVMDGLLREQGIEVLVNESRCLRDALPIIGMDDLRASRIDVRKACKGIAPETAQVILSHNPRSFYLMRERNALILSGHTHGGQVHLPLSSFRRRPHDMHFSEFHDGWYRDGQAQMYVSVGVGSVNFPARLFCPPEVVVFTLRKG